MPIVIGKQVVGVLTAGCINGRRFGHEELQLLEVVGDRVGFAIERSRILNQVQVERARAENAGRFKTTLMHMASHDIKTPLTAMRLQLAILKMPKTTPAAKENAVAVVNRSIIRLEAILDDFLDLARIEAGRFTLRRQPMDLLAVAKEVVEMFAPEAALKKLELMLIGSQVSLEADERRLTQVLVNLVSNALRYTKEGSVVLRVGFKDEAQQARLGDAQLVVADTGIGMTKTQIQRLFQPFGQVHEGPQEGSGLGLHLAKVIIEAHGGSILVESPGPGKGTSVKIELPRHPTPESI